MHDDLVWSAESGIGYLDAKNYPFDYGLDYWQEYLRRDASPFGASLTKARVDLVQKYTRLPPLDIGIGGGRFVRESGGVGYDINPEAVAWLKQNNMFVNFYDVQHPCVTFWDALEHIDHAEDALKHCSKFVFVSVPVFKDREHILSSKHFKPGEHIWYFTEDGFVRWMHRNGFLLLEQNTMESDLGREGIGTFAFQRA